MNIHRLHIFVTFYPLKHFVITMQTSEMAVNNTVVFVFTSFFSIMVFTLLQWAWIFITSSCHCLFLLMYAPLCNLLSRFIQDSIFSLQCKIQTWLPIVPPCLFSTSCLHDDVLGNMNIHDFCCPCAIFIYSPLDTLMFHFIRGSILPFSHRVTTWISFCPILSIVIFCHCNAKLRHGCQ